MTSATLDRVKPRLDPVGKLSVLRIVIMHALSVVVAPHKASLARMLDMPLAVIGTALFDWAFFGWSQMAGLIVTGLSLWLLEYLIADPEGKT
jgi:hypothetical protein